MEPGKNPRSRPRKVTPMKQIMARFLADQTAATAIEYALIAAGISIAIAATVQTIGTSLTGTFTSIAASLK